jgi:hypothetical protein
LVLYSIQMEAEGPPRAAVEAMVNLLPTAVVTVEMRTEVKVPMHTEGTEATSTGKVSDCSL